MLDFTKSFAEAQLLGFCPRLYIPLTGEGYNGWRLYAEYMLDSDVEVKKKACSL